MFEAAIHCCPSEFSFFLPLSRLYLNSDLERAQTLYSHIAGVTCFDVSILGMEISERLGRQVCELKISEGLLPEHAMEAEKRGSLQTAKELAKCLTQKGGKNDLIRKFTKDGSWECALAIFDPNDEKGDFSNLTVDTQSTLIQRAQMAGLLSNSQATSMLYKITKDPKILEGAIQSGSVTEDMWIDILTQNPQALELIQKARQAHPSNPIILAREVSHLANFDKETALQELMIHLKSKEFINSSNLWDIAVKLDPSLYKQATTKCPNCADMWISFSEYLLHTAKENPNKVRAVLEQARRVIDSKKHKDELSKLLKYTVEFEKGLGNEVAVKQLINLLSALNK